MSKTLDEMIEEIAEKRCENMEIQELEQFYIYTKIKEFEELEESEIIEMYNSEVDEDYINE